MSVPLVSGLAELLDSRADTRDMLSASPNLAHACLLLARGEIDLARREMLMGLRESSEDTAIIGRCIEAELVRLSGDPEKAWALALECAREFRFHSVAALYLRFLFSVSRTIDTMPASPTQSIEPQQPVLEAADIPSVPDPESAPGVPSEAFPEGWSRVLDDGGISGLRLVSGNHRSSHGADLQGLEPLLEWLDRDLFSHAMMGRLQHAVFEGDQRVLHHWSRGEHSLTGLLDVGHQVAVLAARLGRAFQDLIEDEA